MSYDLPHKENLKKIFVTKTKPTNKQNETKVNSQMQRTDQRGRGLGVGKMVEGVNCMVMDKSQTSGDRFVVYTDVEL